MFGFENRKNTAKVYQLINADPHFVASSAEKIFDLKSINHFLGISADANTAATLAVLHHQASMACQMYEKAPYKEIAQELIDQAREVDADIDKFIEVENREQNKAALDYGNSILKKLDSGELDNGEQVRSACEDAVRVMKTCWEGYGYRVAMASFEILDDEE